MNTLELDSVILEFDRKRILQDVYLKSETGKITGLLGRNGTGKSSLMKIIYGELLPKNKMIQLNGKSILGTKRSPKDMMYLPQSNFIPNALRVKNVFFDFNLDFSDFIHWFPDFDKHYKSTLNQLSGGERRIIEIYTILVSSTKFTLLDEPFSQLMPIHIELIKKIISREKENKGLIIIDHFHKHMIDICDHLYVINYGRTQLIENRGNIETQKHIQSILSANP